MKQHTKLYCMANRNSTRLFERKLAGPRGFFAGGVHVDPLEHRNGIDGTRRIVTGYDGIRHQRRAAQGTKEEGEERQVARLRARKIEFYGIWRSEHASAYIEHITDLLLHDLALSGQIYSSSV